MRPDAGTDVFQGRISQTLARQIGGYGLVSTFLGKFHFCRLFSIIDCIIRSFSGGQGVENERPEFFSEKSKSRLANLSMTLMLEPVLSRYLQEPESLIERCREGPATG